jgi:endonuclease/exonuclease/phosphatase family metal-dependent hydrolase
MSKSVVVATYNLYLGADLSIVLGARPDAEMASNLDEVQRQLLATSFDQRVGLVADAVAPHAPDLLGLQEVCTWTLEGQTMWDFGALLLKELEDRGLAYEVVCEVRTFGGTAELAAGSGIPGRIELSGSNVVLRRADSAVRVGETGGGLFGEALGVHSLNSDDLAIVRGWCGASCEVDGQPFAFLNTHTEAYDEASRNTQRDELLAAAAGWAGPLVVVGDFNARPESVGMPDELLDAWAVGGAGPGFTCCQAPDLGNDVSELFERIDYVWVRGAEVETVALLGDQPAAGTQRWPSDHAGVVARLTLAP